MPSHWHALTQFPSIAIEGRWCVSGAALVFCKEAWSTHWRHALSQPYGSDHSGMDHRGDCSRASIATFKIGRCHVSAPTKDNRKLFIVTLQVPMAEVYK